MTKPIGRLIRTHRKPLRDELKWLIALISIMVISMVLTGLILNNDNYVDDFLLSHLFYFFALAVAICVVGLFYWCIKMLFLIDYMTTEVYEDGLQIFHRFSFTGYWFSHPKFEAFLWTEIQNFEISEFDVSHADKPTPEPPTITFFDFFAKSMRWRSVILEVDIPPTSHLLPWLEGVTVTRNLRIYVQTSETQEFYELLIKLALPVWKERVLSDLTVNKVVPFGPHVSATKDSLLSNERLFRQAEKIPWDRISSVLKEEKYIEVTLRSEYQISHHNLYVTGTKRELLLAVIEAMSPKFRQ